MQRKTWYYEKWGGRQASFYRIWSVKLHTVQVDLRDLNELVISLQIYFVVKVELKKI